MGNSESKPAGTMPPVSEKHDELTERLAAYLTLDDRVSGESNPLTAENLTRWQRKLLEDPKNRLALSAVTNTDVKGIIRQRPAVIDDAVHVFSDKVELEGSPITNQQQSGRCWIFASTNVLRTYVQRKYNVENFQLSQAYLFFYDKLEKSNYFLQQILETADEELDSRLVQTLLQDPVSDGGQWDMIVNLVNKYGLVPRDIFPDSYNALHSGTLNYVVVHKLREFALVLRKVAKSSSAAALSSLKEKFVREIHDILVISLGQPPSTDEAFVWKFYDRNGKFHSVKSTPLEFAKSHVEYDVDSHFSLIHDPRNAFKTPFTVDRLGNIVEGKRIEYVNAEISVLKSAAIRAIKNNEPVFFGSDVGKFSDSESGVMDTRVWDYELAFNTKLGLTKSERLRTAESAMTHAMVLTAVDIVDGKPTRWRVENSWGATAGDKGYFIMTDEWFDEYVFQVVTSARYVDKEYVDVWKKGEYVTLPRWDPLGALA
ncbi:cysteine proteinase 1, mitochondrial [Trichomonascus vanleenenianus]|uniref:C1 family peptidase n=1 Tax=Trichomonascus vanleenenianus TaxID=2268995 RepID=UPI003EC95D32